MCFPGILTSPDSDKGLLGLSGIEVDTIADLGTAWNAIGDTLFDREVAQQLMNEVEAFCQLSSLFTNPSQRLDASMRIPCADQGILGTSRQRAFSSIKLQYDILRSPGDRAYYREPGRYETAMQFQHDRKPLLSSKGYVGLAPGSAEPGGCICIIFGSTVPFILRTIAGRKYRLVGEAYVYGIMDGEYLGDNRATSTFFLE